MNQSYIYISLAPKLSQLLHLSNIAMGVLDQLELQAYSVGVA